MIIETHLKKIDQLTYNRLKKLLDYNPKTGNLTWKVSRQGTKGIGSIAGYISPTDGYIYIGIDYVLYRAHRLVWFWMKGNFPENEIDHKDRIRSNNKWNNLREGDRIYNSQNQNLRSDNKSGIVGVRFRTNRQKWVSQITVNKKLIHLGSFKNFDDAVLSRWEAEKKYKFSNCHLSTAYKYLQEELFYDC
ncbi:MAG: HNH endonuclease [Bacteroidetes bacterium]|nr:MAG: HNH endonuclease [Bacteroidota bacterium]